MKNEKIYNYPDSVDKKNIAIYDSKPNFRYSMIIPINNRKSKVKKSVMVIMRNPSQANEKKSDKTINNVINFCSANYDIIYLVNLFPIYGTNPSVIKDFIKSSDYYFEMKRNYKEIKLKANLVNDVIVAWGMNSSTNEVNRIYDKLTNKIIKRLEDNNKSIYAVRFQKTINPWHPRNWEAGYTLELYKWLK